MSHRSGPFGRWALLAVPVAWPLTGSRFGPNASAAGGRRLRIRMPGSNHSFLYRPASQQVASEMPASQVACRLAQQQRQRRLFW